VTPAVRGRTLRGRLALSYACLFLCSGIVLLFLADLPLLTFGQASRAAGTGPHPGLASPARTFDNLPEVLSYSGIALAVLAVASLAFGWLMADRTLRPVRTMTAAARAISASNLDERLSLDSSFEEFRELGDTLDDLFARLEAAFESQRRFIANASHELRTPLAAERTVLQVALADPDASAESLRAVCQQLLTLGEQQQRLIDALLTLAVSQRGLRSHEPFDLAEVACRVVTDRREEAVRRDLQLDVDLATAGDGQLAESLVANLVDNAIRHNVTDGHVRVSTTLAAGRACLSVSNTGQAIPPAEISRLFQPFQQLEQERTGHERGHGLGLAIVAAVAAAHHASLTAAPRPGGGLDVTVIF
jgi:signal transduction histidine kinase